MGGPGQVMYKELTGDAGLSEDESHGKAPHIQYRIQAAGGAGVSRRGEPSRALPFATSVSRNLIRVWVAKLEAGTYDEDAEAADLLQEYEAKIAALERLVGRQALEIEFLKGRSEKRTPAEKRDDIR